LCALRSLPQKTTIVQRCSKDNLCVLEILDELQLILKKIHPDTPFIHYPVVCGGPTINVIA